MTQPRTILVADDDPAVVTAARRLLSLKGARVEAVFKALDAIARIRAGGIDAVLLDVRMPEVDGLSALAEIRRLPSSPPVVLMTGHVDARVEAAVQSGDALACLEKPIDFDLAYTLLSGALPEHPLELTLKLEPAALASVGSQALARGTVFLEGAPQLPAGTPVSVALERKSGPPVSLLGVADAAVKASGKRGLGLKLTDLTEAQQETLRSLGAGTRVDLPVKTEEAARRDRAYELYHRGLERLEAGKYDKAVLDLKRAEDASPGDPLIAAATRRAEQLAGVERARGIYKEAEKESSPEAQLRLVEDALRLDPSRAIYHREAARLYLQLGQADKAEEALGAAIHLAPSDPAPRLHLAQLLDRGGRHKEAMWACEAALELFPGDKELGKLAAKLKRRGE